MSKDSETYERSQTRPTSMSSAGDSPVRTSAAPVNAKASAGRGLVFGGRCSESFAKFDHRTSSWRTYQTSLTGGLTSFSETFPPSGTVQNGRLFRRAPSVRHIHE